MGNICRSPSAEGFFEQQLAQSDCKNAVSIDSAGTHSYHIGHSPDSRAIKAASKFGVRIRHLRARKLTASDFDDYDLIVAMDRHNLEGLQQIQPPGSRAQLRLMMSYHPDAQPTEVPDPYYGEIDGFDYMCELLEAATAGLLLDVESRLNRAV